MRTLSVIKETFGILLFSFVFGSILITESHAHFRHDGIEYSNRELSQNFGYSPSTSSSIHYRCSTFINKTDGSHFDEKFEITFDPSGAEIALRDKNTNGTLPRFLEDITSSEWGDWTNRFHRTYSGFGIGIYNEIWVVQFLDKNSMKIYRTLMLPYTKDKQHSLYVSSCEEFH